MSNRRIEMHEYRQIIYRLQKGQSVRTIAREGLASRDKIKEIKEVAEKEGWLSQEAVLPDGKRLSSFFDKPLHYIQESKSKVHAEIITSWLQQGIQAKVIYQHLKDNYSFD